MSNSFTLPEEDAIVDALVMELRRAVGQSWARRAEGELTTALVFTQVARNVLLDGAAPEVVRLAARAVSDEVRHAEICRAVALRYLGSDPGPPRARRVDEARFGDAPPEVSRLLLVVFQSCINEGIASAFLQHSLSLARSPTVIAATRQLLGDDIDHARIGWAHLSSGWVSPALRAHVVKALPTLLRLGRDAWLRDAGRTRGNEPSTFATVEADNGAVDVDSPEHGCFTHAKLHPIVRSAVLDLILPGFEHVGIDTCAGQKWAEQAFR